MCFFELFTDFLLFPLFFTYVSLFCRCSSPLRYFRKRIFGTKPGGSTGTGTDTLYLAEGDRDYMCFNGVSQGSVAIGPGVGLSF